MGSGCALSLFKEVVIRSPRSVSCCLVTQISRSCVYWRESPSPAGSRSLVLTPVFASTATPLPRTAGEGDDAAEEEGAGAGGGQARARGRQGGCRCCCRNRSLDCSRNRLVTGFRGGRSPTDCRCSKVGGAPTCLWRAGHRGAPAPVAKKPKLLKPPTGLLRPPTGLPKKEEGGNGGEKGGAAS